ncbi:MAG: exonuclease domain-containing protein [Caldisericia bacterium]|jgi:DNA polymerase III alpha subunit (gram-positive type)|nr:exonuclease domain-containing protein [Caldisericia bacterium]
MILIFFDIETTGLNPEYNKLVEIGCVKVYDGEIKEKFTRIIDPKESLPDEIKRLTGLTEEDISNFGVEEERAIREFFEFIDNYPLIGHNILNFDVPFIETRGNIKLKNRLSDTLIISKFLAPNLKSHSLRNALNQFGIPSDEYHRAIDDAILTFRLWEILKERSKSLGINFIKRYAENMYKDDKLILDAFYVFIEDL